MFKIAARSSLSIIAVFCLISVIAFSSLKISFFSFIGNEANRTESYLYIMSLENRSLQSVLPERAEKSLGKVALELLTNINLSDMKSFLISEIPGLDATSPKILIAGEGTDFTNLPIESPPPPDFGLNEGPNDKEEKPQEVKKPQTNDYTAFIYHSHTRESFLPLLPGVTDPDAASSKDKNVTLLGTRLGQKLEENGIKTLVDTTDIQDKLVKRNMNYYQSYAVSREIVVEAMNQNKKLQLIFDIHRDSQRKHVTTTTINGLPYAKLYFVIGKGNLNYRKNLQFAEKLHNSLKNRYPSLSRGVFEKPKTIGTNGVYNQDLAENVLVIEIGGVDNNLDELNRSVDALGEVISNYYWGEAVEVNK
ncbi:stage II sporulation protein P [Lederbergia citrea]|uniref:Stage II sporulation protein P n=1 Tax=Lederbergia citrea TaxID=2833581 RepID=A0A942Z2R6_9BACI|nr:stage II sporulation protein P [Lederbergia citrea]MBS4221759.1 stage II sporulation protein P [Lederbergia citrea]